jgi:YidC/Oxa1 family membrane protein insertase
MPTNATGGGSTEPPSLEKRLPIALGLMMLVFLVSQYIFKPAAGPKPAKPIDDKRVASLAQPAPAPVSAVAAAVPGQVSASAEQSTEVDTDLYRVIFTNRGAVVKSWVLKHYTDSGGSPLELVNQSAFKDQSTVIPAPFAIEVRDARITVDPNAVLYQVTVAADKSAVEYVYSDGRTTIKKSFRFNRSGYLCEIQSSVLSGDAPVPHFLTWRGGFGDPRVFRASVTERTVRYDTTAGKLIEKSVKDAKKGTITDSGNYTFGGLEDNFFAAVALPQSGTLEIRTFSDEVKIAGAKEAEPFVGDGVSTGATNDFSLFVGPKDIELLKRVNPKLSQIVDWGFFGVIAKPIFIWLNWTHDHWTGNYGWAIVIVTIIINLALLPLRFSSLKSARKMQQIGPQVKAINEKYKNIKINDPRKAEQNQEVMALYKKEGVNPVGGCVPLVIQIPFFYAFYRVLSIAIELRHAPWLWVSDLSAPETLPVHLLPIILVVSQLLTQRMTPTPGMDPTQQKMTQFMPVIMGFIFYSLSSGLVLYYLTSNIVGIGMQLAINRFMPPPAAPPVAVPAAKQPVKRAGKK